MNICLLKRGTPKYFYKNSIGMEATAVGKINVIEKTILLYKNQGIKGERFEETIKRIGFENVEKQLFSDELLDKKEEILNQELATAK